MKDRKPVEQIVAEQQDFPPEGAERGPSDMSGITLHMLGHAHIDLGYRWDFEEAIHRIAPDTFRGVLELMQKTPGFTFCQSQMFLYAQMEKEYPAIFARIRQFIAEGRWEVVGGAWCEYDAILPSGEAVIRQHLQGLRYAQDNLGVQDVRVAFVPDSFIGHAATLPQILSGCGIRYYLFCRGLPKGHRRAFRWVGPDGSGIVAYLPFGPYSNPPLTKSHLELLKPFADAGVTTHELALYGTGDHGGGPRQIDIDALLALEKHRTAPKWRYGTAHQFLDLVFAGADAPSLKEHRGSMRSFATGSLTSQAQAKRENRLCEHKLITAEALCTTASIYQRKPAYPRIDLMRLWRRLLALQFHDVLPGTSVAGVYRQALAEYEQINREADMLVKDRLARIGSRLDTRASSGADNGFPLLVLNPCLGARKALVPVP